MRALEERARVIGAAAARRAARRGAALLRTALPGVRVRAEGARILLSGRGLNGARATEAALRWIAGLWR